MYRLIDRILKTKRKRLTQKPSTTVASKSLSSPGDNPSSDRWSVYFGNVTRYSGGNPRANWVPTGCVPARSFIRINTAPDAGYRARLVNGGKSRVSFAQVKLPWARQVNKSRNKKNITRPPTLPLVAQPYPSFSPRCWHDFTFQRYAVLRSGTKVVRDPTFPYISYIWREKSVEKNSASIPW